MSKTDVDSLPKAASLIDDAPGPLPDAALPDVAQPMYRAALAAMQDAEEIWGDMPDEDYVAMMRAIASEAIRRSQVFVTAALPVEAVAVPDLGLGIYEDVLEALSGAERVNGPVSRVGCLSVLYAVAAEATCRAANCIESLQLPRSGGNAKTGLRASLDSLRERERTLRASLDDVTQAKSMRERR